MNIVQKPIVASNYSVGRTRPIDMIVIHVGQGTQSSIYNTFNNPTSQVSSHYCVSNTGEIWQFVDEGNVAYHAGIVKTPTSSLVLSRPGVSPNSYSIGIEHEGGYAWDTTPEDFTDAQYKATAELVSDIAKRHGIPLDRIHVVGHKEIRTDKSCPGTLVSIEKIIANPQQQTIARMKKDIIEVLNRY